MLNENAVKAIAFIFGFIMLIVGILGFVPAVTVNNMLLGIFHVNALHNYIHIATGLIALLCGIIGSCASRRFFQVFGIVYGLIAILGFFHGDAPLFGVVANNLADAFLHVGIAIFALWVGFSKACHRCCRAEENVEIIETSETITKNDRLNGDKNI